MADGLEDFAAEPQGPRRKLWYERIVLVVRRGSFVATLCVTSRGNNRLAQVDVSGVGSGKIVAHWDAVEPARRRTDSPTAASSNPTEARALVRSGTP